MLPGTRYRTAAMPTPAAAKFLGLFMIAGFREID
jgi:hypothetical protein